MNRRERLAAQARDAAVARAAQLADAVERRRGGRDLEARLDELEATLGDVRRLAARTYEHSLGWEEQLAELRATPDYGRPWEEAEPLVSVRIPTYDNAAILCERTLASVRAQTYERWEAVVVGDAVNDDTERRVAALGDPRIRFINLPFRGPYPDDPRRRALVAGTRPANLAVREARGAWIAPLDHDDAFAPDHIEVLLRHARETRAELVYGKLELRARDSGERLAELGGWPPAFGRFGFQGALYHRALGRFGHDELAYLAGEPGDWNLARRMWEAGVRFAYLDRVVTAYFWAPRDERDRAWLQALRTAASASS
jgi:cellulose synthase/poly-beta-1,6-N-acetylglucosamine synthase-like glycosyltransferase